MLDIKTNVLKKCIEISESQLNEIQANLSNLNESLNSATKSSAGDKHETSRAMIQLEIEKLSKQLLQHKKSHSTLLQIQNKPPTPSVELGSLVITEKGAYFIATSIGKVTINNIDYFVISPIAPIGQAMLGKKIDETIRFNNLSQRIESIL